MFDIWIKRMEICGGGYTRLQLEDLMHEAWNAALADVNTDHQKAWDAGFAAGLAARPSVDVDVRDVDGNTDELLRLATFLLHNYPNEPGRTGVSESAVDVAIRLLAARTVAPLDCCAFPLPCLRHSSLAPSPSDDRTKVRGRDDWTGQK